MEKYIAKSAAKNISSLESQTIVPTLTILGLVNEWIWLFGRASAVTRSLLPVIVQAGAGGAEAACRTPVNCPFVAGLGVSAGPPGESGPGVSPGCLTALRPQGL